MSEINFSEMVATLVKPGQDILSSLTPKECEMLHYAIGVSGEVGELMSAVLNYQTGFHPELDVDNCVEECSDILFFIEALLQKLDRTLPIQQIQILDYDLLIHTAMASIYAADLLDTVKKSVIYRKELDTEKLYSLLLALDSFIIQFCRKIGSSKEIAIQYNIEKLSKRYAGLKYSNEAAQNRADKQ